MSWRLGLAVCILFHIVFTNVISSHKTESVETWPIRVCGRKLLNTLMELLETCQHHNGLLDALGYEKNQILFRFQPHANHRDVLSGEFRNGFSLILKLNTGRDRLLSARNGSIGHLTSTALINIWQSSFFTISLIFEPFGRMNRTSTTNFSSLAIRGERMCGESTRTANRSGEAMLGERNSEMRDLKQGMGLLSHYLLYCTVEQSMHKMMMWLDQRSSWTNSGNSLGLSTLMMKASGDKMRGSRKCGVSTWIHYYCSLSRLFLTSAIIASGDRIHV